MVTQKQRIRRKTVFLPITGEEITSLRLSGLSFSEIAEHIQATKQQVYSAFTEYKNAGFNGYEPIPVHSLKQLLNSGATYSQIANTLGLSPKGLNNYLTDRNMRRVMDIRTIQLFKTSGKKYKEICDYYGVTRQTLWAFYHANNG